jgi:hypothetical protein
MKSCICGNIDGLEDIVLNEIAKHRKKNIVWCNSYVEV